MVAGPKDFVDAVAALHEVGVLPERILAEDFPATDGIVARRSSPDYVDRAP
jgi:hypothetical protein